MQIYRSVLEASGLWKRLKTGHVVSSTFLLRSHRALKVDFAIEIGRIYPRLAAPPPDKGGLTSSYFLCRQGQLVYAGAVLRSAIRVFVGVYPRGKRRENSEYYA